MKSNGLKFKHFRKKKLFISESNKYKKCFLYILPYYIVEIFYEIMEDKMLKAWSAPTADCPEAQGCGPPQGCRNVREGQWDIDSPLNVTAASDVAMSISFLLGSPTLYII